MTRIGNVVSTHTTIALEARKSFALGLWFMDQAGIPADLSGCTVRLVVKQAPLNPDDVVDVDNLIDSDTATLVDPVRGYCIFELQAAELDLTAGEYPFTIVLTTPAGYSSAVVKGVLDVAENTEFASVAGTFTGTAADPRSPQSLAVTLDGLNVVAVSLGPVLPPGFGWLADADQAKLDQLSATGNLLPDGGEPGQVLGKASAEDRDFRWVTLQAFDGTLNAAGIPAGRAPVSDGADGWAWGEVSPTVDWALAEGAPGSVLNKPVLGTAAAADATAFAAAGHTHTDNVAASRLPKLTELRGVSSGTADPTGGEPGDLYLKYLP